MSFEYSISVASKSVWRRSRREARKDGVGYDRDSRRGRLEEDQVAVTDLAE